jgi:hypothetical protein
MNQRKWKRQAHCAVVTMVMALCGCRATAPVSPDIEALLRPGPAGTPLPPRNTDAAHNWPPEFKRFIDAALEMFREGQPEPSIEEFEARLGIKLTPKPPGGTPAPDANSFHRAEASWIPSPPSPRPPERMSPEWRSLLAELPSSSAGIRRYLLSIEIDPTRRYCISPYALAIYTGARFTNIDNVPPSERPRPEWARAYEWGMFKRGYFGNYRSDMGFGFRANAPAKWTTAERDANCILDFRISANFKSMKRSLNTAAAPDFDGVRMTAELSQ